MTSPLSVCVLACNEADELTRCLRAISGNADEVVVVIDAKSRDASEAVARRMAQRVVVRAYEGDIQQKRFCTELAKNDWVMIVDPDEVVTTPLWDSIHASLARVGDDISGFRVNRATYHLGRWIRHGDFYPDWKLRIFRRSSARWEGRDPHGRVEVDGIVVDLEGELEHYSYRDLGDQISRIQFFSDEAAASLARDGVRFRLSQVVLRPPARFLRTYFLRQGFRDGLAGFIISAASAFYVFLKYAKLWEKTRARVDAESRSKR